MVRRPKTMRVARTRAGGEWTESSFWLFIRSGLRQMSKRWPPTTRLIWNANRRAYKGPNKRQKWEFLCSSCGGWFIRRDMHCDHIVECGTLKSFSDIATFAERLFCEVDGLRIVCEDCHEERHKLTGAA